VALARRERAWLAGRLARADFKVVSSQANFVFAAAPWGTGQAWFSELMKLGVIVRPMPGPYLRITAGTRKQNERLLAAVKEVQQTLFNG
jgi:histidinol-phosphate/aromatic aminotransferase/cobyric acid decarboxylase-like protein